MFETNSNGSRKFAIRISFNKSHKRNMKDHNWPIITALIINTLVFITTLLNPEWVYLFAVNSPYEIAEISWLLSNFTHIGFWHFILNMICLSVGAEELRYKYYFKPWVLWFLYIGCALLIGPLIALFSAVPVAGYSGVVMAFLTFGILNKIKGYKFLAGYLIVYHIIILALAMNVSVVAHAAGAFVGAGLYFYLVFSKQFLTWNYRRKNKNDVLLSWREKHSKL